MQALKAGKHVFCEKPPAMNAEELEQMIEVAETSGKTLMFKLQQPRPSAVCGDESRDRFRTGWNDQFGGRQNGFAAAVFPVSVDGSRRSTSLEGVPLIDLIHMLDLALYYMGYPEPDCVVTRTFDDFHE